MQVVQMFCFDLYPQWKCDTCPEHFEGTVAPRDAMNHLMKNPTHQVSHVVNHVIVYGTRGE